MLYPAPPSSPPPKQIKMKTADLIFTRLSREDCRIVYAALRDKRDQMLASQESERLRALHENRAVDLSTGEQAHRIAVLMSCAKQAHDEWPKPVAKFTIADEPTP